MARAVSWGLSAAPPEVPLKDLTLGSLRIRLDVVLVLVGVAVVSGPALAMALGTAILFHELGHAVMAFALTRRFNLALQLTGGSVYIRHVPRTRDRVLILLAGPAAGVLPVILGTKLLGHFPGSFTGLYGAALRWAAIVWSVFQLTPFPPLDGGLLLRRVLLKRLGGATTAWRLGWLSGFTVAILVAALWPHFFEPVVWLTGMTVILGRAEAGYVRHVDAFEAWERGDHREVLGRVRRLPEYLPRSDAVALTELGLASARALDDEEAAEELAARLPAARPATVEAAEWLLLRGRAFGARLAEQAFDALDSEAVRAADIDRERWADLAFRLAIYEAAEMKPESALGMLERAADLGFDDVFRLEAEGEFERIRGHPRFVRILARLRGEHG